MRAEKGVALAELESDRRDWYGYTARPRVLQQLGERQFQQVPEHLPHWGEANLLPMFLLAVPGFQVSGKH